MAGPSQSVDMNIGMCIRCADDITETNSYVAGSDRVCAECANEMLPFLHAALRFNKSYQPPNGIRAEDFAALLPPGFADEMKCKEREYKTPVPDRVYCRNTVFASKESLSALKEFPYHAKPGMKKAVATSTLQSFDTKGIKLPTAMCSTFIGPRETLNLNAKCLECSGYTCSRCDKSRGTGRFEPTFDCDCADKTDEQVEKEKQDALNLGAWVEGHEYRKCPNRDCSVLIELADGCNHISCSECDTQFCLVCGEIVPNGNCGHWDTGKPCPRYGRKNVTTGAHPALFDGDQQDHDDDPMLAEGEADPWPPVENTRGLPVEVLGMLDQLRGEYWAHYIQNEHRLHSRTIATLAKMTHDVLSLLYKPYIQLDFAEASRGQIGEARGRMDPAMQAFRDALQDEITNGIGQAGLAEPQHLHLAAVRTFLLSNHNTWQDQVQEADKRLQGKEERAQRLQVWKLTSSVEDAMPAQVSALLAGLSLTYQGRDVYATAEDRYDITLQVAKTTYRTLIALYSPAAINQQRDEQTLDYSKLVVDADMALYKIEIEAEKQHGDWTEVGRDWELIAGMEFVREAYNAFLVRYEQAKSFFADGFDVMDVKSQPSKMLAYECIICIEDKFDDTSIPAGEYRCCAECGQAGAQYFMDALHYEKCYPPTGNVADYLTLLPADFAAEWHQKVQEYEIPTADRLYCPCHVWNGQLASTEPVLHPDEYPFHVEARARKALNAGSIDYMREKCPKIKTAMCSTLVGAKPELAELGDNARCLDCDGYVCTRCWKPRDTGRRAPQTACKCTDEKKTDKVEEAESQEILDVNTLVDGKLRIRKCPNKKCTNTIELHSACNHIQCPAQGCKVHFCMVCGEILPNGNVDHWAVGKPCPLYGLPSGSQGKFNPIHAGDGQTPGADEGYNEEAEVEARINNVGFWPLVGPIAHRIPSHVVELLTALRDEHREGFARSVVYRVDSIHLMAFAVADAIQKLYQPQVQLDFAMVDQEKIETALKGMSTALGRVQSISLRMTDVNLAEADLIDPSFPALRLARIHLFRNYRQWREKAELAVLGPQQTAEDELKIRAEPWELIPCSQDHMPIRLLAELETLRHAYKRDDLLATGRAAQYGPHHVAKAVHNALHILYAKPFPTNLRELKTVKAFANAAMKYFEQATDKEQQFGIWDEVEDNFLLSSAIELPGQEYKALLEKYAEAQTAMGGDADRMDESQ
ncbi:hypothetical protein LTR10_007641 [Elasticomyces elasticus]|nr:hypothetical protein LTR10_007641 [Elasticomyces elasticus]KAK4970644.1 hypothetical protein LTR42_007620 [Elasticomyces elasticus]